MADEVDISDAFIVVILGCTGTGKSKLAIEIAQAIDGEIISADSMQVYKDLDIITNKVSDEEQAAIRHYMINIVGANDTFSVVMFKNMALPIIRDILGRGKVPIIVGGTNYYIEALLWENLIESNKEGYGLTEDGVIEVNRDGTEHDMPGHACSEHGDKERVDLENEQLEHESLASTTSAEHEEQEHEHPKRKRPEHDVSENADDHHNSQYPEFEDTPQPRDDRVCKHEELMNENLENKRGGDENISSANSLYKRLVNVDPEMARKLHPNDTRKIARSLQVYEHAGKTHSALIAKQQSQEGATALGGPMRFKNACVLWLQCELDTLDERLDTRVDKMLEQGLVEELLDFYRSYKSKTQAQNPKPTEGIFQSIGFKEFHEFLSSENTKNMELFSKCVDSMKSATRRYARKQIKWVTNRFLGRPAGCSPDVYGLDATDLEQWQDRVLKTSLQIVNALKAGEKVPEGVLMQRIVSTAEEKHSRHVCEICNNRPIIGDRNWSMHLQSRSHKHYKKKKREK